MFRENNFCASCLCSYGTQFEAEKFIKLAKSFLPSLNEKDGFVRSGLFIHEDARDFVSSFRSFGSFTQGDARIDVLQLSLKEGVTFDEAFDASVGLVCRHLLDSSCDAAFAALTQPAGKTWKTVLVRSPRFCTFEIPRDILSYMTNSLLDSYLEKNTRLSKEAIAALFSDDFVLADDFGQKGNARLVDAALKALKFCEPAAGNGQIALALANLVVKKRLLLNRFFTHRTERNETNFMRRFCENSLFATDCDAGAVELLKLEIKLNLQTAECDGNIVWGNVLLEDLFDKKHFDLVISNPPHLKQDYFFAIKKELADFKSDAINADIYCYYIERAFDLLKRGGEAMFLTSNRWMRADYGANLRAFLAGKNVKEIIDYGNIPVLDGTVMPMSLITAENAPSAGNAVKFISSETETAISDLAGFVEENRRTVDVELLSSDRWKFADKNIAALLEKIASKSVPLEEYVGRKNVFRGLLTGCNKAFTMPAAQAEEIIARDAKYAQLLKPFLSGRNVKRYAKPVVKKYLICIPRGFTDKNRGSQDATDWFAENYFELALYLSNFQSIAEYRHDKGDYWWEMRSFKHYGELARPKIICPSIVSKISATIDFDGLYSNDKTSLIIAEDYYLLGLLNSKLMDFYFRQKAGELLNGYYELKPADLQRLPVKRVSSSGKINSALRDKIAQCAMQLLEIYARGEKLTDIAARQKASLCEKELNAAVAKLYKLTRSEIKLTENF